MTPQEQIEQLEALKAKAEQDGRFLLAQSYEIQIMNLKREKGE